MSRIHYEANKLELEINGGILPVPGISLNKFRDGKLTETQQFCTLDGLLDYAKVNGIAVSNVSMLVAKKEK